jgi:hypothetical protein
VNFTEHDDKQIGTDFWPSDTCSRAAFGRSANSMCVKGRAADARCILDKNSKEGPFNTDC